MARNFIEIKVQIVIIIIVVTKMPFIIMKAKTNYLNCQEL